MIISWIAAVACAAAAVANFKTANNPRLHTYRYLHAGIATLMVVLSILNVLVAIQ